MGVPAVFNIEPSRGPTAGRALVQIYGDNFRLPIVAENPSGVTPPPEPSVEVLFDGEPATDVQVLRTNRVAARTPISPISGSVIRMTGAPDLTFAPGAPDTIVRSAGNWKADGFRAAQKIKVSRAGAGSSDNDGERTVASLTTTTLFLSSSGELVAEGPVSDVSVESRAYGEGKVDVVVRNLDDNGDPIPGEEITVEDGYHFSRVRLTDEAHLTRLVREFVRLWRKQVIANVSTTTHTEYDADTGDEYSIVELAELPGIGINGPDLSENRFFSINGTVEVELPNGEVILRRVPYTVDLTFEITGVSNSQVELLNLMTLATQVVDRNPYFYLDRDPNDPSQGRVRYEMDFETGGDFAVTGTANADNLRSFSGTVVVRGFEIEDLAGFTGERGVRVVVPVEELEVSLNQTGESYDVGPSPGGGNG